MVLKRWETNQRMKEVDLSIVPFWIQIDGLSPEQMTVQYALMLEEQISRAKEVDTSIEARRKLRNFVRVRVESNTDEPLLG